MTASIAATVVVSGFVVAFVFGAVANRTNFCTMGAIPEVVNMGDCGRVRMWALAVALLAFALADRDFRRHPRHVFGGVILMGAGGVLATGCTVGQGITGLPRSPWDPSSPRPASSPAAGPRSRCSTGASSVKAAV